MTILETREHMIIQEEQVKMATEQNAPVINFWDPLFYEDCDEAMRWLLEKAPVYRCAPPDYPGEPFWVLSKWADIRAAGSDWKTFSSAAGVHLGENVYSAADSEKKIEKKTEVPDDPRFAVAMKPSAYYDPPQHTRLRGLVRAVFHPKRIRSFEEATVKIVDSVLDGLPVGEPVDVAEPLSWIPCKVVCEVLGVGESRSDDFMTWTKAIFSSYEPDTPPDYGKISEMFDYLDEELEARRQSPREDALTDFVTAEYEGSRLTNDECLMWSWMLLAGGQDTTTDLIVTGLRALLEHPQEWQRLVANPDLARNPVEELLRWVVPDRNMGRTAACDTEIRGVKISKGDFVLFNYVAANRDPDTYDNPDVFDIGREFLNDHLAFGFGPHYCAGQVLARMEGRVFLERMITRFPNTRISGPVASFPSIRLAKTRHLTVTLG